MRLNSESGSTVKSIQWNRLILAAAVAAAIGVLACTHEAPPAADVWAVVNGKQIKRDQVDKLYRASVNPEGPEVDQEMALLAKLDKLDQLILKEILLERAKKLSLEASNGEVEDKFTELKSPYTEEEFQRQLKESGQTVDDYKEDLRSQLSIQKLLNREVVAKISITDQEIKDYYERHPAEFNVPEALYRVAQIVVTPVKDPFIRNRKNDDATNEAEAKRKLAMLEDRLNNGADFAQLAADYSEDPESSATGGDLGPIKESDLNQSDPALKRAVLALKPRQVSPVIALKNKYTILKLLSREAPGKHGLTDPEVQQFIRDTLKNSKEQLLRAAYFSLAREEAHITNYFARQVLETNGKLPDAAKVPASAKQPIK